MPGNTPAVGAAPMLTISPGTCNMLGCFQGNAGASPLAAQIRGNRYTVAWISLGLYRVTLLAPPSIALVGTASNNMGLECEAKAWITSESVSAGVAPIKYCVVQCGRVTPAGTFDIFVYDVVGAVLYNVTSADRVNFEIYWKVISGT